MILKITNEVSMWQVWDNLRFFDKETLEAGPHPGYIVMFSDSSGYSDEHALVSAFREMRWLLELFNGDAVAARQSISNYSVLDLLQDVLEKKRTYMFMQGNEYQFDIFLKMYQRRNISRALVPLSHYEWRFNHFEWAVLMQDLAAKGKDMVVIGEGIVSNMDDISFFAQTMWVSKEEIEESQRRNMSRALVHWSHYGWVYEKGLLMPFSQKLAWQAWANRGNQMFYCGVDPAIPKSFSSYSVVSDEVGGIVWMDMSVLPNNDWNKSIDFFAGMMEHYYNEVLFKRELKMITMPLHDRDKYVGPWLTSFQCENPLCKNFCVSPEAHGIAVSDWKGTAFGAVVPNCDVCGKPMTITQ